MTFDLTKLAELNTATKYPSIETYHVLGDKGRLTEGMGPFASVKPDETVYLTEKVDGTNGRIVLLPGGDFFIGSREELLYARGDRVKNPALSIVPTLAPVAHQLVDHMKHSVDCIEVLFFEVYGGKIGGQAKQYSRQGNVGYRLFDHAFLAEAVLERSREDIANWRDHGGQAWEKVSDLEAFAEYFNLPLVPYLETDTGQDLPKTVAEMYDYLTGEISETEVFLDEGGAEPGKAEGLVLRTGDRRIIAKARFQDYERTLKSAQKKRP